MQKKKQKHPGLIILLVFLILIALLAGAIYWYATRYAYDVDGILSEQTEVTQTVGKAYVSGSVSVFYSPARVYEKIDLSAVNEALKQTLHGAATLEAYALVPGEEGQDCVIYARMKLLGLLPLTLRAEADISAQSGNIGVWLNALNIGTELAVPLDKINLTRSFTLSASAPVSAVSAQVEGFTVSYRFLQEHFLTDAEPDTELAALYARFCPALYAEDATMQIWAEQSTLTRGDFCSLATDADTLCALLALAKPAIRENFFRTLSDFERETFLPNAEDTIDALRAAYTREIADAYTRLNDTVTAVENCCADKKLVVSSKAVMLRAKHINDSTLYRPDDFIQTELIDPAESRLVLLYSEAATVKPNFDSSATLGSLESNEVKTAALLVLKRKCLYAPALVTRLSGTGPCLLYRGENGEIVLSLLTEDTYASLIEAAGLLLLEDYQTGRGVTYDAPAEDLPGWRLIEAAEE